MDESRVRIRRRRIKDDAGGVDSREEKGWKGGDELVRSERGDDEGEGGGNFADVSLIVGTRQNKMTRQASIKLFRAYERSHRQQRNTILPRRASSRTSRTTIAGLYRYPRPLASGVLSPASDAACAAALVSSSCGSALWCTAKMCATEKNRCAASMARRCPVKPPSSSEVATGVDVDIANTACTCLLGDEEVTNGAVLSACSLIIIHREIKKNLLHQVGIFNSRSSGSSSSRCSRGSVSPARNCFVAEKAPATPPEEERTS